MRLGQLARQLNINTSDIVSLLNEHDITINDHPNVKIEGEPEQIVLGKFGQEKKPEKAETKTSEEIYYDGTINKRTTYTRCNDYITKPQACVSNPNCGWCSSHNTCVNGTSAGPNQGGCGQESYIFNHPGNNWNPFGLSNSQGNVVNMNMVGPTTTYTSFKK
jgi:hypothetical protein